MLNKFLVSLIGASISIILLNPLIMPTDLKVNLDNREARLNIYNYGKASNSVELTSEDKKVDITYPAWLQNVSWERGGGAGGSLSIKTASQERTSNFQIKVKGNGHLVIQLVGPDRRQGNKKIPTWIDFKEISINGQAISGLPVRVSHDKPHKIVLSAKNDEILNVSLKHHKIPLSQISGFYDFILSDVILFILLFGGFWYGYKYLTRLKLLKDLSNIDFEQIIVNQWRSISSLSKKSYLIIFITINVIFLFHTVNFYWGNHDWYYVKNPIPMSSSLWCGRFAGELLQQLFGGDFFPVINMLFCFAGYCLAAIYLAKYWKLPQTMFCYVLFGLVLVTMPYALPWLFFLIQTTLLVNIFLVVFALYLSIKYNLLKSLIAIFLMVICLGAYASMLSTIAIVVLGRMLNEWLFEKTSIKELIKNYTVTFINVLVSVIIFKLIWMYYTHTGVIQADSYNFASITLADVPTKLELVLKTMLEMFYVPQPYISTTFKLVMAIPLIASIFYIVQNKKDKFGLGILFVVAILFSSQFSTFLAKTNFAHTARIDFFSLPFLFTLFMIICLKAGKQYKNLAIIIMLYAFVQNTYADARYQKVNYLGRKAEMLVYEDIISRIKSNNNFERNKQYIMITAGTYPMRPTYYHYNKYSYEGINADLLYNEHIAKWDEKAFYNFYEPTNYVRDNYKLDRPINFMPSKDIVEDISDYILHKAQPYPHKNSVYVKGNYIYVIYSESGLKTAQHNIKQYLKDE